MQKLFFYLLMVFAPSLDALIIEASHFSDLQRHASKNTLIILDIDDTLLIPVQMLGCDEWFLTRLAHYQEEGKDKTQSLEKSLAEWEAVRHLTKMEIVEPGTDEIIAQFQEKGYQVMGLTTQGLSLATRTHQQLKQNNINLSLTALSQEDCYLNIDGHGVLFRNGILFTSGMHKGKALFSLLSQIQYSPKQIVFINDKASHLMSIEVMAEENGIEFIGLRYNYSDSRKAAFKKEIADYQFCHSTFSHLLSDLEAANEIRQQVDP